MKSKVIFAPEQTALAFNTLAEEAGLGEPTLSVELRHADGSTWRGCQAWGDSAPLEFEGLVVSVRDTDAPPPDGFAFQHWTEALGANGLTVYAPDEPL
ncbi:hypothetical protein D3C78_614370 [compost metagenome]